MEIALQLDTQLKTTVEELFLLSAQAPAFGLEGGTLAQDGLAIFRIAKEFSLKTQTEETRLVDAEDIARLLRFTGWILNYGSDPALNPTTEKQERLRQFLASIMLQAQSQFSGFEALLRSFGVDRQLDPQIMRSHRRPSRNRPSQNSQVNTTNVNLARTDRTHHVQIKVDPQGAELSSTTTDTTWTANGWKQSIN